MARKIVIGDIHGGLKALEQLIAKINIQENDSLIFLGDYVDGWSESAQLMEYLIYLDAVYHCVFIKGNHDEWCELWLENGIADMQWLYHGGKSTVESYKKMAEEQKGVHLDFFNRMKNYYVDDSNRLFVHAGFSSMHGAANERYESNYFWDRTLWEMAVATDSRLTKDSLLYPKRLLLYNEIYIGHTPTLNYHISLPMQACNVWNVDTGAAFMGKLSAMDIDTKNFWQSDPVMDLYPGENGRNKQT